MSNDDRHLRPSADVLRHSRDVAAEPVTRMEGSAESGGLAIKPVLVGGEMLLMEVHRKKGLIDPEHDHPDHESMCYLVKGRMRVVIEGEEFIAEPGATWVHRPGVRHYHEALEDSVQIEVKSPPTKTWA